MNITEILLLFGNNYKGEDFMKLRRIISVVLVAMLAMSMLTVAATAAQTDIAETGYYNQTYLENYAAKAVSTTDLGCTYTKAATTFKVWAPEANSVMVKMYSTGTDAESGATALGATAMNYDSSTGIWSLKMNGDQKNKYYTYVVDRGGVLSETPDPYATAVGANGDRSMVCDLDATDPEGWDQDQHVLFDNPGEAVVWEIHVRDFSIDVSSGVSDQNKGKYLAFTEGNTTVNGEGKIASCVDYLVEHNVNCVQLMPIEDFASIDETDNAVRRNWGYDPKNFNVPEGSYSSDPYDGNTRITEFKMLVQALHDRGIAVVMDVVYNHTFVLEGSPLSMTTPKYYYRMSSAENYHNGSGLGNCLSTEKAMTRKYVSDSLCYWANEYHIDGFRFDLMGCFDLPSVQSWRADLNKIDSRIMMYGEPWAGSSDVGIGNAISNSNLSQAAGVGAFNQTYSDELKGDHEIGLATRGGFINGGSNTEVLKAAAGQASFFPSGKINQMINYTDNHDNLTLFDKLLATNNTPGYKTGTDGKVTGQDTVSLYETNKNAVNNPSNTVLAQMKLGLTSALTTQGVPFTVAGTEFCRTKYGDGNSYRTPDNINAIDWTRADKYSNVSDYYAGLIAIRKAYTPFIDSTANSVTTVSGSCTAWQLTNNKSGEWNKVIVALNNTSSAKSITLSGSWNVVANGTKAGTASLSTASGSYSVPAYSGVVLVDSASFGNYKQPALGTASVTVEHYTRDAATGSYKKVRTETAKYKEGQTWRASKNLAILFDHNLDKVESTASGNATYGKAVAGSNITVKYYYTRYINTGYLTVNFLNTVGGEAIKTPMTYRLRQGDKYSIPATGVQGYELDSSKYPGGTIGVFDAADPPTFNFYYKALTNTTTRVHYYNAKGWSYVLCYAYDDLGNEPLGAWALQKKADRMLEDTSMGAGWVYKDVPAASCYVMFHYNDKQVPGQGEKGYPVSGEAWIKDGIVSFNNTIVTSHIELETGEQLSDDVVKQYTSVSSNQIYTTSPNRSLRREYITPANATGFYQAGVTNVVYLYGKKNDDPGPTPGDILIGDVDQDGEVTIFDATEIQRYLADMNDLDDKAYEAAALCDGDDEATVFDVTYIQRFLADMDTDGSRVNESTGDPTPGPGGKHSFEEFVELYNELSTELAKYSATKYGTNEYYQAAAGALSTYRAVSMNPSASAEEIDAAYEACKAALDGLANIPVDPVGDIVTLYFSNNKGWDTVNVYMWGPGGEIGWPGVPADYEGNNDYGEGIFSVTVDTSQYNYVIFNNNGDQQTTDISVYAGMMNGCYCLDTFDEEGHYDVGFYDYSGTGGGDDPGPGPDPDPPIPSGSVMYMVPSSEWQQAGARFAAYFFEGDSFVWMNMRYAGPNLYVVDIPEGYSQVVFVRMSGSSTENNWENKWNQTEDLPVVPNSTHTVEGWGA